jgi:hypothetical protein
MHKETAQLSATDGEATQVLKKYNWTLTTATIL